MRHPVVVQSNFHCHNSECPLCAVRNLGKATRKLIVTKSTSKSTNGALERGHLNPGDCILMDQYQVAQSGRTLNLTKGTLTHGAIFVDHASGRMIVHHQESLRAKDQNGVAEMAIGTVSTLAMMMLIHTLLQWPLSHDIKLWPLCFLHAVCIYNRVPGLDSISIRGKWHGFLDTHDCLQRLHPWGYVQDMFLTLDFRMDIKSRSFLLEVNKEYSLVTHIVTPHR